jgi:NitT/TauT family transport system substrate-binding protein
LTHPTNCRYKGGNLEEVVMMFFMILWLWALILGPSREAWAQKSLPTVRIGIEAVAGTNSHYYVTKQLGLFQKQGLNLELISFPGGTVGIQSLLAGDLQFATADGNLGLTANLRGANLYFIAGMINTFPFSILSKPEIRTPQDLRGKKIVISRYGSSSDTAVRAAVEKYDLRPDKDVIILQGGGQSERFAALKAGAVDAAIVSPPLNLTGRSLGFNEVIDLSQSGVPYAHQQIVAQKDFIERNPDLILRTLRALIEGLSYWKDASKKEVVIGHVAKYLRLDPQKDREQLEETYRYYGKTFPTKPYPTLEGVEFTAQILKKNRPEAKDLQAKDYVMNRFVGELEKEGFLARVFGGR